MSFVGALLFTHVILYLAWKMTAMDEKNSRADGSNIPTYATGGLGNLIGFSLMTTGVGLAAFPLVSNWFWLTIFGAVVVTIVLHLYWQRSVKGTTASLYLPDGSTTVAGWLHLLYVVFISYMILTFLTNAAVADIEHVVLFSGGVLLYVIAFLVDRFRGVI